MGDSEQRCAVCGEALIGEWERFVLLPDEDVPVSGSRTEIVVQPSRCRRVEMRACPAGHLSFRAVR